MNFLKHSGAVLGAVSLLTFAAVNEAKAEAATIINDFGCTITASASGLPNTLFSSESHSVETKSGNTVLKCYFDIPEADKPTRALVNQDFPCNTFLGLATKSHVVSSPGGKVILTCEVKTP